MNPSDQYNAIINGVEAICQTIINQYVQSGQLAVQSPPTSAVAWKQKYLQNIGDKSNVDDPGFKVVFSALMDYITSQLALIQGGNVNILRGTFTNTIQDGNQNATITHNANNNNLDTVITIFDNNGQRQNLDYQNINANQTLVYIGKAVTGTWRWRTV
jgi:hypothetical protein